MRPVTDVPADALAVLRRHLLTVLVGLQKDALNEFWCEELEEYRGICSLIDVRLSALLRSHGVSPYTPHRWPSGEQCSWASVWEAEMERAWITWPKFSGNKFYPVPSPGGREWPSREYHSNRHHWSGEYGELRRELLDYLVSYFTTITSEED